MATITSLASRFLLHPAEFMPWLVQSSNDFELSKTHFFLVMMQTILTEKGISLFILKTFLSDPFGGLLTLNLYFAFVNWYLSHWIVNSFLYFFSAQHNHAFLFLLYHCLSKLCEIFSGCVSSFPFALFLFGAYSSSSLWQNLLNVWNFLKFCFLHWRQNGNHLSLWVISL